MGPPMSLFTAPTPLPGLLPPPRPLQLAARAPWPRPTVAPPPASHWLSREVWPGRATPRGGRCGVWLRPAPVGRRRDGPGAAAEELPGGRGGLRGAALGFPRPHPAVQGLVRGGRGLPGHRRGKRHVLGHLHQGREALGPHGAAEGLRAGWLPLLHQPREPQGEGAGRQSLCFARLLLGTPQPAGPDRGLGEAAAGGGIGAVLPLPPQKQPDRGRRQPAEHRHSGQGVFKEEEHGAGGAVQGDGGAQAGILGGLHPAAGRCGVLAGPNQPPARPHRLPPPAGWLGPPGRHDAPGRGRVGLRTLRPVRLLVSLAAFARSGVSPVPNLSPRCAPGNVAGLALPFPGRHVLVGGSSPAPETLISLRFPVGRARAAGGSQRPAAPPRQHMGSGRWWLINHVNDCGGTKKDPSEPPARVLPPPVPCVSARTVQRAPSVP